MVTAMGRSWHNIIYSLHHSAPHTAQPGIGLASCVSLGQAPSLCKYELCGGEESGHREVPVLPASMCYRGIRLGWGLTPPLPRVQTWGDSGCQGASGLHGPRVSRGSQPLCGSPHEVVAADGHYCLLPQWVWAKRLWLSEPQLEQPGVLPHWTLQFEWSDWPGSWIDQILEPGP